MHRYRLTFLPWSWPPFIKNSTDTAAGSTPPPPTQNRPRFKQRFLLDTFCLNSKSFFCAPEYTTLLSFYQVLFTPPQTWDHLCFPLVVGCGIDISPTHPSSLWIRISQKRLLRWSSLELLCHGDSVSSSMPVPWKHLEFKVHLRPTTALQLGKMDPADLITSWFHFNNLVLMTYMCYPMQNL